MAEASGRKLTISISPDGIAPYVAIASVRSKTITINNEQIDITTDDSDAWRTLLEEPSVRSVDLSVSGVTDDDDLMSAIMIGTSSVVHEFVEIDYNSEFTLTGKFALNNLTYTGEHADAATFEASLQSSGAVTKA